MGKKKTYPPPPCYSLPNTLGICGPGLQ
jgi:hypothetical protein